MAPGARIVLIEANSQSLGDLMSAVAAAADLPGVSVVSMSWGFIEGRDVLAADEAMYDGYLTTPAGHEGVTFVASTGDYSASVPQYPAFSPNVVAVGGTSLYLNGDNSYSGESAWGGSDSSSGMVLGGGGGVSLYEAEPAYQTGVQSTGYRTTPDVSFVADPNTGAWIADTYNLSAANPWQVVGGTSLSAPSFAALFAIVNQGRVLTGLATLNTNSPVESQQALYSLPTTHYHDVIRGNNGYAAGAGYDLATGLGTPIANLLVPALVGYSGAGNNSGWQVTVTTANSALGGPAAASIASAMDAQMNALQVFDAETLSVVPADGAVDHGLEAVPTREPDGIAGTVSESGPASPGVSDLVFSLSAMSERGAIQNDAINSLLPTDRVFLELALSGEGASSSSDVAGSAQERGENGDDVLLGGDGDDLLIGGNGDGLLIGGVARTQANVFGAAAAVPTWFDELTEIMAAAMSQDETNSEDATNLDQLWADGTEFTPCDWLSPD